MSLYPMGVLNWQVHIEFVGERPMFDSYKNTLLERGEEF